MKNTSPTKIPRNNLMQGQLFDTMPDSPERVPLLSILPETEIKQYQFRLRSGLHVAIVSSTYGDCGGSMFAWETYVTCMLSGIQAVLVSFDAHHHYPKIGLDLRRLAMPADTIPEDVPEICAEFQQIVKETEEEGKYLIIDTPTGFTPEHPMFELLQWADIPCASSIAALLPVLPSQPNSWGASLSADSFTKIGIYFERGLFRFWDSDSVTSLPQIPIRRFELWKAATLSGDAIDFLHNNNSRSEYWRTKINSPQFAPQNITRIPTSFAASTEELTRHLEDARMAIFDTILSPISISI